MLYGRDDAQASRTCALDVALGVDYERFPRTLIAQDLGVWGRLGVKDLAKAQEGFSLRISCAAGDGESRRRPIRRQQR